MRVFLWLERPGVLHVEVDKCLTASAGDQSFFKSKWLDHDMHSDGNLSLNRVASEVLMWLLGRDVGVTAVHVKSYELVILFSRAVSATEIRDLVLEACERTAAVAASEGYKPEVLQDLPEPEEATSVES